MATAANHNTVLLAPMSNPLVCRITDNNSLYTDVGAEVQEAGGRRARAAFTAAGDPVDSRQCYTQTADRSHYRVKR
jgi:hypothetical protein